jgi:hypothetical protein
MLARLMPLTLACLVMLAGPASGHPRITDDSPKRDVEAEFRKLDANGDGALSAEELGSFPASRRVTDLFGKLDRDADGRLSLTEFRRLTEMRDRGALNRSTRYERLSRPKGPRGVSDEAFEQEASPSRGGGRQAQAG